MSYQTDRIGPHWLLLIVLLSTFVTVSHAQPELETRLSTTAQGKHIQRGRIAGGSISHDEYKALITVGAREKPVRTKVRQKLSGGEVQNPATQTPNTEFWFYAVDVELFSDFDHDGYFYGIDVLLDVDTVYAAADVYAVLYLSYEYGPWNEYAMTEDFTIFGASSDDEYIIVTELISGYETGSYDLLIDLYDTFDGILVATIGPEDSSELSLLPLEDANRDAAAEISIVVNSGGGGSAGWLLLLVLAASCGRARYRRLCGPDSADCSLPASSAHDFSSPGGEAVEIHI